MNKYNPSKIEKKWQNIWFKKKIFQAKDFAKKPKKYVLIEFPYPSGEGLHMGHLRPYVAADVFSRYSRLRGQETLFPIGWDAFGLPAENFAIKNGVNPAVSTARNIKNAKRQLQSWGMSFDWSREINTTDPSYYRWTQWIFLQFYKAGLAYEATGLINWCPKDKTGLANEEVIDGKCERCGTTVEKKEMRQWYLKITAYAEKLLEGLKTLREWPEAVKVQQENWIGKSVGAEIDFAIAEPRIKRVVILHAKGATPKDDFYPWLKKELESKGFAVEIPALPNPAEPNDLEQVDFVEKNCTIDESTVLVGHSFGGIVALRFLERGHKVHGVVFAGTPMSGTFLDGKTRPTVKEAIDRGFDFKNIKSNADFFKVLSDSKDYVVSQRDGQVIGKNLDCSPLVVTANQPHFLGKQEQSILDMLLPNVKIFTTRPDTIFGATYMVLAPEHPLVQSRLNVSENRKEIEEYLEKTKKKSDIERSALEKEKTGVELKGVKVINPATQEKIPVWIADYVLWGYGTGAIMAVPAHDERDFEFAKKFGLPIKPVIYNMGSVAGYFDDANQKWRVQEYSDEWNDQYGQYGKLVDAGQFTGMKSEEAIPKMAATFGKITTQYKLRDWVFSRQRYWGEPIPVIHCEKCGMVPVPEKELPVKLPSVKNYQPTGTGESPLAAISKWVNVKCPSCGGKAKRETNTMPQWAGSSWYWLRYTDPKDKRAFADKKKQKYWTPVDVYFGGMEHTTLHLLYSRFWNLFLYDQALVASREPYLKRQPHGLILAHDGEKMSKSRGNVVNPDDAVKKFGADCLRMHELFLGPHESNVSWNDQGLVGVRRFLDRVWGWVGQKSEIRNPKSENDTVTMQRNLHKLIKKITEDLENFRFNTSISAFMEFLNENKSESISSASIKSFLTLLYPFAPHIAEELNAMTEQKSTLQKNKWPEFDPRLVIDETIEIVVQVNGKVKGRLNAERGSSEEQIKKAALELEAVKKTLGAESVKRVVFVPNKLMNLVI